MALGMGLLAALWFFPTMGAALLGFLMKKNSIIENGPTGPLVGQNSAANAVGGWAGLSGVAVVAMVLGLIAAVSSTGSISLLRTKCPNVTPATNLPCQLILRFHPALCAGIFVTVCDNSDRISTHFIASDTIFN